MDIQELRRLQEVCNRITPEQILENEIFGLKIGIYGDRLRIIGFIERRDKSGNEIEIIGSGENILLLKIN
jgi:hypothetical protein